MSRTPDEIRNASMARFNELAAVKFDEGVKEHQSVLDEVVNFDELEQEIIDMWHYTQSLKHRMLCLQRRAEYWEEIASGEIET
mgnify:CR=1 FL=1